MNVVSVQAKGDKAGIMVMEDGSRVWTPEKAKADELVGKPIPADWTQKQGEYGPQAFPPRERKGGAAPAAFRNTKEGQAIEQDGMNRRTALMQAVAYVGDGLDLKDALTWADSFYEWLSGSPVHSGQGESLGDSTAATTTRGHATSSPSRGQQAPGAYGEGTSGACSHVFKGGKCKFCGEANPWA